MKKELLAIENLNIGLVKKPEVKTLVHDLSLTVSCDEIHALVGESGSGKSLTALSIMGLLPAGLEVTAGRLMFANQDLASMTDSELRKKRGREIAMIFQEPMSSLNPLMTIGKQLVEPFKVHKLAAAKEAREKAIFLLEKVGISNINETLSKYPFELSGGQQQRVMIAMALTTHPKLLIADEATTALDVTVQKQVLELLASLKEEFKMSVLFITHDLGIVSEIADEVSVVQHGYLKESASCQAIFMNPQHAYTRGLISCRPPESFVPSRLATLKDIETGRKIPATKSKKAKAQNGLALLTAAKVSKVYSGKGLPYFSKTKDFYALRDVSMELREGEILGIVGESGSGKTTLGRILSGLDFASSGKVTAFRNDLSQVTSKAKFELKRRIQYIFQDPAGAMNPRKKISEIMLEPLGIHFPKRTHKENLDQAISLLEQVGLDSTALDRFPHQFSGGQKQRICIARALTVEPEVLICDESVSALDVSVQASILNLLLDLREKKHLTFLFISHDLNVVRFFCDRLLVMYRGEVVEEGPSEAVYGNPQHRFTRKLLAAQSPIKWQSKRSVLEDVYEQTN